MKNKKNGFFTFIFSLLPGAGEMYFGLFKQGTLIMSLFFGVIAFCAITQMAEFAFLIPIIWCFGFFHVHQIKNLSEEEFNKIKDEKDFIKNIENIFPNGMDKIKKIAGYVIVLVGIIFLGRNLEDILINIFPQIPSYIFEIFFDKAFRIVLGIIIVYVGIYLVKGKKKKLEDGDE